MASAMNRLGYDPNTYQFDVRQSQGPGQYAIGTPEPHCLPCFQTDARLQNGTTGASDASGTRTPLVDVSSELLGITRPATNCPTGKYAPPPGGGSGVPLRDYRDCPGIRPVEDTRLTNPPCTLRGTGWNRWEWLCQDPQERVLLPFDSLVANRIVAKDNHRPLLPTPLDQTAALPPGAARDFAPHPETQWSDWVGACSRATPMSLNGQPLNPHWRKCNETARIHFGAPPVQ